MSGEHIGTCFGFLVESAVQLSYVRGGSGEHLDVEIDSRSPADDGVLVKEWKIQGVEPFHASLYARDGTYRLWTQDSGWFEVDPAQPRISLPANGNPVKREERLWGIPTLLCFVARGDAPLHAAAVDAGRGAILLAAPGRHGKTTLAAGFVRRGNRLLSEDLSCLRTGVAPVVVPGPAMLRIRPDVAEVLDIPRAKTLEAGDERLHLALDAEERGDCTPVEIRAVVFLRGAAPSVELRRVEAQDAIPDLFALCFRLPGAADTERAFGAAASLAAGVPVWDLSYPLRLEELDRVVDAVGRL